MNEYSTSQIAKEIGIHPNTVRFYEELELLPTIPRKENGYRVYHSIHLEQLKLIKMALKSPILQNGLRKQVFIIIKESAKGNYERASTLLKRYLQNIEKEQEYAYESIRIVESIILKQDTKENDKIYTRKQVADHLNLTIDTLRNWELNGLIKIKRKKNGYRVYDEEDIKKLKIIRTLKFGNFSLSAILRLIQELEGEKSVDIKKIMDTPKKNENIISVYDKLLTSLLEAKEDSKEMIRQIEKMKKINPPV